MQEHAWIDRSEYPFASHGLDLEAGRMHYVDEGSGRPIVMVHGNPTWSFLYRHLIKQLSPDYRCVAMDHLGFGLSSKPTDWSYHPEEHARNLETLIETLGLSDITLVVQDWGGPIGLSYAVNHPQNVRSLVIMNTWMWPVHRDPYYVAFNMLMGGFIGQFLIRRFNFFARVIMRLAFGDTGKLSARIHAHYLKPLEEPPERKGCWVFPRQILGSTEWLRELWEKKEMLKAKPMLIVWGMRDMAFRKRELKQWEAAFPEAEVIPLDRVGHFVQEEAPEALARGVKRFVSSEETGRA